MPQTVEAIYHDGVVELKHKPAGIKKASVLVVFFDTEEPKERHTIDWDSIRARRSSVDKWIGILQCAEPEDWKAERRAHVEGKHQ